MPDIEELLAQQGAQQSHFFGKYRGQVADNDDPLKRGRLRVRVPAVLNEVEVWALPCVPYAGPSLGFYFMPEVGAVVWVEFEAGDTNVPIWSGFMWNDGDVPSADAKPDIKFIRTKKFTLRIDDSNGEIIIENDSGSQIKITAQEILHKSSTVKQEAAGNRKTELSSAGYRVNEVSLEVL